MATATGPEDLLAALDPEQRRVAEALRGPVRVLAGAGTGKTRAITHRIAHGVATGVYAPTEVLAVTFTTRAAGEMRGRLRMLGAGPVQARTFHSAALRQLRYFWPRVHGTELPTLVESKIGLLATAARRQRLSADQALLRDLASEVEWAKVSNVHPDDYARLATRRGRSVSGHDAETVARVFAAYEETKRAQGRMDMEDVLLLTAGMLADDERVAAQVRRQYKWFVVDEFQDVSPLQSALLDLWLGGRDELCVVGDPAQTIYSFAGANAGYLRDFATQAPEHHLDRAGAQLPLHPGGGHRGQHAARRHRQPRRRPAGAAPLRARGHLHALPRRGRRGRGDGRGDPAAARAGPVAGRGRGAVPHQRPVRGLRGGAGQPRPAVRRPRRRPLLRPARGAPGGDPAARRRAVGGGRGVPGDRARHARGHGLDQPGAHHPRPDPGPLGVLAGAGRPGRRSSRRPRARRWGTSSTTSTAGPPSSTRRSPTGSPWPPSTPPRAWSGTAVFLCGLQDGTLPITYAESPAAIEEERRLLYVGMTRARLDLSLSWAQARNPGGRASRKPSRFLDGLLPDHARPEPKRAPPAQGRELPRVRPAAVHRRGEEARPLRATARRRTTRRCSSGCASGASSRPTRSSVPAFVVFTDATLQLIAEHRPQSPDAMLRDQRHRPVEARAVRRGRPRAGAARRSEKISGKYP